MPRVGCKLQKHEAVLHKGSCVPTDSKQYVFKHCTNTKRSTPFNFSLCVQCVEYTDGNDDHAA
jgi:hypothetical protein